MELKTRDLADCVIQTLIKAVEKGIARQIQTRFHRKFLSLPIIGNFPARVSRKPKSALLLTYELGQNNVATHSDRLQDPLQDPLRDPLLVWMTTNYSLVVARPGFEARSVRMANAPIKFNSATHTITCGP